jgi:hypothetical protein
VRGGLFVEILSGRKPAARSASTSRQIQFTQSSCRQWHVRHPIHEVRVAWARAALKGVTRGVYYSLRVPLASVVFSELGGRRMGFLADEGAGEHATIDLRPSRIVIFV